MSNTTFLNTPPWLDTGDNAWQLTAATLVGLQSIPGLLIMYGGLVKRKWAINSAFMVLVAFAEVLVCWVIWAYKMSFGAQWGSFPLLGEPGPVLKITQELAQAILPASGSASNFPLSTMIWFQFVFAAITLVLIGGAYLGRMNFLAWVIFVPLWLTCSYTVGAFSIWGGGFLFQRGLMDYSGGYVIHLSSGTAGFIGSYWIGPRLAADRANFQPNNVLMAMAGAGILWMGWTGFNGGDPFNAGADAGVAVLNTHVCTATSLLVWTICDTVYFKRPSIVGAVQGIVTGLVAITPAAGFVDGWGAIIIGVLSGSLPWVSMNIAGKKLRFFDHFDDVLGVVHTHMVAGFIGGMATGVFATTPGSIAFAITNPGGAIEGNWKQLYIQFYGALFIIALNIVMTSLIMLFIKHVCRVPLRMSEAELLVGDDAVHGESAYAFHDTDHMPHGHSSDLESGVGNSNITHRHEAKSGDSGEHKL